MKEEWAIKISMLIDGELSKEESSDVLDKIQQDDALRERWLNYQAASNLIRSEADSLVSSELAERVRLSLQSEPTVLAPVQIQRSNFWSNRTTVGAIAASVLVFAVVVGNLPGTPAPSLSPVLNVASNLSPLPEKVQPTQSIVRVAENEIEEEVWIQDERLNAYLMRHSEKVHSAGAFGVLPLARVVSYGNGH